MHTGQSPLSPTLLSFQDAADCKDEELQLTLTLLLAPSSSASASTSSSSPSSSQAVPPPLQPRVPALSVTRKTTLPKPPRITTQLNLAWMLQAMGTCPANDTFAVRQPSARRAPVDLTTVQRFMLVYWDKVCALRKALHAVLISIFHRTASCRSFWASPSARHGRLSDSTRTSISSAATWLLWNSTMSDSACGHVSILPLPTSSPPIHISSSAASVCQA